MPRSYIINQTEEQLCSPRSNSLPFSFLKPMTGLLLFPLTKLDGPHRLGLLAVTKEDVK